MTTVRLLVAAIVSAAAFAAGARAQEMQPPKPGPEHEFFKKMVGTWDTTMTMMGQTSKGTCVYKMDVGGLWLSSTFESDMGGQKFVGKGFDTYDQQKKKYIGVWVDSWTTLPIVSEGTYDAAKKSLVMHGEMRGENGQMTKVRMVSEMPDENTIKFGMYPAQANQPMFTIEYKRKK